jgi:hypothetical protein
MIYLSDTSSEPRPALETHPAGLIVDEFNAL